MNFRIKISQSILFFRWCGNSMVTFVNTLMIFAWLFVVNFVLGSFATENAIAPLTKMFEYITPIIWKWENWFLIIFASRITYNAYNIYRHDWRYLGTDGTIRYKEEETAQEILDDSEEIK